MKRFGVAALTVGRLEVGAAAKLKSSGVTAVSDDIRGITELKETTAWWTLDYTQL